jgi:hypothetical protein
MLMAPKLKDLVGVISRQRAVKGELHRQALLDHGFVRPGNAKRASEAG